MNIRTIPVLLLKEFGLVKTTKFKKPKYLGDPINIIKIFNDKEVDELILLDINATKKNTPPQYELIAEIASECFMPLCYGGGIRNLDTIKTILSLGVEKIAINSYAIENPQFIGIASEYVGSQTIVVSIDVKKNLLGKYEVYTKNGTQSAKLDPVTFAIQVEELGAGEIFLNSIDRDGTMKGYDVNLISKISRSVSIPVIACGGAGKLNDFSEAVKTGGASAVAAGSFFVFHGPHRAVLINVPSNKELTDIYSK